MFPPFSYSYFRIVPIFFHAPYSSGIHSPFLLCSSPTISSLARASFDPVRPFLATYSADPRCSPSPERPGAPEPGFGRHPYSSVEASWTISSVLGTAGLPAAQRADTFYPTKKLQHPPFSTATAFTTSAALFFRRTRSPTTVTKSTSFECKRTERTVSCAEHRVRGRSRYGLVHY